MASIQKRTPKEIFDALRENEELLRKFRVRRIGLFGSTLRGDATPESDIDFLVDFEVKSFDNFIDLNLALEELFGVKVDILTHAGLSKHLYPYVQNEVKWYERG